MFLLSDFLDQGFERSLKVTGRRHDLIPLLITDAREQTLPNAGWIVIEDAESGEFIEVNTGDKRVRATFAQLAHKRSEELRHSFRRMGTDLIELNTDAPYLPPIRQYMERRLQQRHR